MIVAYIQETRLEQVLEALNAAGIHAISVAPARGCGAQRGYEENYRGARKTVRLLHKLRLELAVTSELEQPAIDAITRGAQTGKIGAGKIFVLDVPKVIRIRTLESGTAAL